MADELAEYARIAAQAFMDASLARTSQEAAEHRQLAYRCVDKIKALEERQRARSPA